ncbi:GNAT family N-acetyltransferase [Candidatus Falkowbacteria bacterium]|nr:GNAT family N-acetyltransferase [Candidatus Falkowbacteria bacterium]
MQIVRVNDKKGIALYKNGFVSLYQEAFAGPPYYESFTVEQISLIMESIVFNPKGILCLGLVDQKIIGLVGGFMVVGERKIKELLCKQWKEVDPHKVFYMAELAVSTDLRKKGFGTKLTEYCLKIAREEGNLMAIIRTQKQGSNSRRIFERKGFSLISEIYQDVETLVTTGGKKIKTTQRRIFLFKKL